MGKLAAVAVGLGLLIAGLAGAAPAAASGAGPAQPRTHRARVHWGPCSNPYLSTAHAQCGYLRVPLDYRRPGGPTIAVAVSRIRHTSTARHYQGVLLTNPGGPGVSGLDLAVFLIDALRAEHLGAAAADYDWIGFDPRGVGSSIPALSCDPSYFGPDRRRYDPATRSLLTYWLTRTHDYATACDIPAQRALLRNMTTVDVARDMNAIRRALGRPTITYYGFSYGTYLGQVFATLYPHRVRRLILDSNIDPRHVWYQANLNQDSGFNRNIRIWFGWLARHHDVYRLGRTRRGVQHRFYAERHALAARPIRGIVGPDEWTDVFLQAAYFQQAWRQLGRAFAGWAHGHGGKAGRAMVALYGAVDTPGDDNGFAAYNAVQCTDVRWPASWARWSRDNTRLDRIAPFDTWGNAWLNAPCLYWPAGPARTRPMTISGRHVASALLIDETLDAATPFEGSVEVRRLFPHSVLLAEPGGTSHADSLSGDRCVDATIARYLEAGKLPGRHRGARWDKTCKPLPRPVPGRPVSRMTALLGRWLRERAAQSPTGIRPAGRWRGAVRQSPSGSDW
jgi:pimeloyl-ACP methyl ester carboxylesterase